MKSDVRKILDSQGTLPDDAVLGHIVWFTISDQPHNLDDMTKTFDRLMLDSAVLPQETTAFSAYEKACSRIVGIAKPYTIHAGNPVLGIGPTVGEVMAVREVSRNGDTVYRQMVREVRDSQQRRLSYQPIVNLDFSKGKPDKVTRKIERNSHRLRASVDTTKIQPGEQKHIEELIKLWYAEFDRLHDFVDGDRVRKCVREYLLFLNAIKMKDGVYFVHRSRESELFALQEFVRTLTGCNLEVMPIPEMARLRESVIAAWEREAVEDFQNVVQQITHLRSTRDTITSAALAKVTDQYQRTMRKAMEYGRALHVNQEMSAGAAEYALAALNTLQADFIRQEEK
jgi:hypothetical protein